jgi:YggT family protein
MLMQILSFLLEVVFGLLASACLLRFFMQRLRVPFANSVGRFVIAVTNWLVLPLRRVLPQIAGWDTSSLVAAWLLVLAHQALLLVLGVLLGRGALDASVFISLPIATCFALLRLALSGLLALLVVNAVLSWIPQRSEAGELIERLCAPLLAPIRRRMPLIGGIDLSVLVAIVLVQVAQMLLGGFQGSVMRAL